VAEPLRIDAERLSELHEQLARHGALAGGGVNRQALSPEEISAWGELIALGEEAGLTACTDAAANLFLRIEGRDPAADPVLSGSHLDTQPTGGRFDGVYGILAALEAVRAIRNAGHRPRRPIEVVAWMNEEGSRFAPGMMGSSAFAGAVPLESMLDIRDAGGTRVREAIAAMKRAFPALPERPLRRPVHAYLEAHIEQGPVLDHEGTPIGVVSGIQGKCTFRVTVNGTEAHAGTTPRARRRDALLAATAMIGAMAEAFSADEATMFTVGRLVVEPNAPSVVPAKVVFSVDVRHPLETVLKAHAARVHAVCASNAAPCSVVVEPLVAAVPLEFPASMRTLVSNAAQRAGLAWCELPSAAGHDSRYLHAVCPTGMIFIPCRDGISHNPAESATSQELANGARVLAEALLTLAEE